MIVPAMTTTAVLAAAEAEPTGNLLLPEKYDIVWSILILLVIGVGFYRYILPKFTAVLDERTAKIEGGLAHAESVQAEAEAALERYTAELAQARADAARIRDEARVEGAAIVTEARVKAGTEADRILESAQRQIEAERTQASVSLRTEVGVLATQLASKIVGEALDDAALQSRVVDRFLDELDATTTAKATPDAGQAT